MIKFSNACRKDCPWLLIEQVSEPGVFPKEVDYSCRAFGDYLKVQDGEDNDGEVIGIFKCIECMEIGKPEDMKDVSIDSLTHTVRIMTVLISGLTISLNKVTEKVDNANIGMKEVSKAVKKANLQTLIDGDPGGGGVNMLASHKDEHGGKI